MTENFNSEIFIAPCFQLWNRGDGIGEISIYNKIVAYIHGENEYMPNYYWDEETSNYQEKDDVSFEPVSCFPGHFQTSDESLIHLNSLFIESLEHLQSLLENIPNLPEKPKGSVFDLFSQSEKFLTSLNFDFNVISSGHNIEQSILNNFNQFSQYFFNFIKNYPEINVSFLKHCYLNENVYFNYIVNEKYFLHLVFSKDDKIILGEINKRSKMNNVISLSCSEDNFLLICNTLIDKLNISSEQAELKIKISIDNKKNNNYIQKHCEEIIQNFLEEFKFDLMKESSFILQREFNKNNLIDCSIKLKRSFLNNISDHSSLFNLNVIHFIELLLNQYYKKY